MDKLEKGKFSHFIRNDSYEEWHEYDAAGNMVYSRGSNGIERWCEYDAAGNMVHFRDSNDFEEWHEYDAAGNKVYSRGANGLEEWTEYDASGNEVHRRDSDGYEEWREYDAAGNEVHRRDSDGYEEWHEYDAAGNMVYSRGSDGTERWCEYDAVGNEVHSRNSSSLEEWCEYDAAGNAVHYKDSYGREKWWEYDAAGNMVHSRNSSGLEEWYEYDGYYRAIGKEAPEVPVSALFPERKKVFDKAAYYSRMAEKESVDFVKARFEEKAEYWNKIFRGEPVSREMEENCRSGHEWTAADHYVNARHKLEKNLKTASYSHAVEILQKRLEYWELAAREEMKVNAMAKSLDSAVPLLGKKELSGVPLDEVSQHEVHKLGADEEYDEENMTGIKGGYGLDSDDSWGY